MKNILLLLISIWTGTILAQSENYMTAYDDLKSNYNTEKYDEIFTSFSPEMQSALPIKITKNFFKGLKKQAGKMVTEEFVSEDKESGVVYKTKFEHITFGVYITLSGQNKISGLLIRPSEEPNEIEVADINGLDNYPNKIAESIFSSAQNLPNNSQLSIAIIQNGKANYYGTIRDGSTIKPTENQTTLFEIGSITKVFTSTVLASLVQDNKINLTDEINSLYDFDFNDNTKITFESLANHSSGLPRLPGNLDLSSISNPYKDYGKEEIEMYLKDLVKLDNVSSKSFSYSNLGAGLLGYTLGIHQKKTFQELLKKCVFDKYDMNNSHTTSQDLDDRVVKGMNKKSDVVSNWDMDALFGAGGILSSTEDLVKFARAQFNPAYEELSLTRLPTFKVNDNLKMGLGWHIVKSKKGKDLYWHNGGTGGYSSSMTLDLKNETAVIILSNVAGISDIIDKLGMKLLTESLK